MAVGPLRARNFWQELETQTSDSPTVFSRDSHLRSSYTSPAFTLHPSPITRESIYCTIRNRKGQRSTSAPSQRATLTTVPSLNTAVQHSQPKSRRLKTKTMSANEISLAGSKNLDVSYRAPKRYETTCYFKPLAVPVWYSTSIMVKINSTKKKYTESVTYKNKLVPYRYVEKMSTMTSFTPQPATFVSNLELQREVPVQHFISLEPQQKAAFNKPFTSDHSVTVKNYI